VSAPGTSTAVVTGAGRGIGREIARRLVGRGYRVLVTDVDAAAAERTATELGPTAWAMALDVRDPDAHRAAAAAAAERGPLAVWVNNAGVLRTAPVWEHPDDDVRLTVECNVLGVMWGSRAAVDAMRRSGGHIVNLASMSAFGPVPGLAVYAATKHAVLGFTTSLQGDLDLAGLPVRVHAVCPDAVPTDMVLEHRDEPDSAILFSATNLVGVEKVADAAMALLDGRTIVRPIPRSRAWILRGGAAFPRLGLTVLRLFRWRGERRRVKAL